MNKRPAGLTDLVLTRIEELLAPFGQYVVIVGERVHTSADDVPQLCAILFTAVAVCLESVPTTERARLTNELQQIVSKALAKVGE